MPATTPGEVLARIRAVQLRSVYYHQYGTGFGVPPYWRPDCSGAASYAYGLRPPGLSTVTLPQSSGGPLVPITWAQLRAGDAVMRGGAGTGGSNGHIGIVVDILPAARIVVWEQGGGWGPTISTYTQAYLIGRNMKPYRSVYLFSSEGDNTMYAKYGDGPEGLAGDNVETMQLGILAAGGTLPHFGADRDYGDETANGLVQVLGVAVAGDGHTYGPKQLRALDVAVARHEAVMVGVRDHKHTPGGVQA